MIVTTMDGIAGRMTQETLGLVRGTSLWTRRVIKCSFGGIRNFQVSGLSEVDKGINQAREEANASMLGQATAMGADSIVGVRIEVIEMSNGVFCVNATGTAVKTVVIPASVPAYPAAPETDGADVLDMAFLAARPSFEGSVLRH